VTGPEYYFDLEGCPHRELFAGLTYVWQVFSRLESYIGDVLRPGIEGEVQTGALVEDNVWIGPQAVVEAGSMIKGPAIIGAGTQIRHGAYIRGNCLIGNNCVVGHATELKNVIMFDGSQAPHFNYLGDSILGKGVNLGAGTRLANLKNDYSMVKVQIDGEVYQTGLKKLGAIVGDQVHVGCNVVSSPGTLIGPNCLIYPLSILRGFYPAKTIVKLRQNLEEVPIE
jgi:NDP-sugar pyrophosphorylase family protein